MCFECNLNGLSVFCFFFLIPQGLYCISVNCMDNAEAQFTTALRVSPWTFLIFILLLFPPHASNMFATVFQLTTHQELWTYIVTNLASVYIREGNRHQEVSSLTDPVFKSQHSSVPYITATTGLHLNCTFPALFHYYGYLELRSAASRCAGKGQSFEMSH